MLIRLDSTAESFFVSADEFCYDTETGEVVKDTETQAPENQIKAYQFKDVLSSMKKVSGCAVVSKGETSYECQVYLKHDKNKEILKFTFGVTDTGSIPQLMVTIDSFMKGYTFDICILQDGRTTVVIRGYTDGLLNLKDTTEMRDFETGELVRLTTHELGILV